MVNAWGMTLVACVNATGNAGCHACLLFKVKPHIVYMPSTQMWECQQNGWMIDVIGEDVSSRQ